MDESVALEAAEWFAIPTLVRGERSQPSHLRDRAHCPPQLTMPLWRRRFGDDDLRRVDPLKLRDRLVSEAAASFAQRDVEAGRAALEALSLATIDEKTLAATDGYLRDLAADKTIVATTDIAREPAADEVVIVYGNFPHVFGNVVVNNPIKRHVASFGDLPYDVIESDPRWGGITNIVVINADGREDRRDAVLGELARARAPLDRIVRQPAVVESRTGGDPGVDASIGCHKSHLAALRLTPAGTEGHTLVLEDDFCFTSELETHLDDLALFVERRYDYVVCLLSTSKYGRVAPRDDLVSESHQPCTNTGAYLVPDTQRERLISVQEEALRQLIATGDSGRFAVDRYWRIFQPEGRFLVFRRKMGFQAASYSDIERRVTRYLD